MTVILGLPLMALGQTEPQEKETTQGQTKETQTTAPAKGKKKMHPAQEQSKPQAKPETGTDMRGQTNVKGRSGRKQESTWGTFEHERDERRGHKSDNDGEQARVQVASQRSVQSWPASERVLRPTIRGESFPVDRQHVLRVRG